MPYYSKTLKIFSKNKPLKFKCFSILNLMKNDAFKFYVADWRLSASFHKFYRGLAPSTSSKILPLYHRAQTRIF